MQIVGNPSRTYQSAQMMNPLRSPSSPCKRLSPDEFAAAVAKNYQQKAIGAGKIGCPICGGEGYYRQDVEIGHPNFGQIMVCGCNVKTIDERSGLSAQERMIDLTRLLSANRPGAARMKYISERFIKNPVGFAAFFGGYGNGKTLALQAIVNGCLGRGIEARYITGKELVLYLREAFDPQVRDTDVARINQLARVPVLVIDELADAGNTPYAREMQQHLINARYRYASTLGTVFAWNVTWADIPWPGVVSRIKEFEYNVAEVSDSDLRPALGAAKTKMMAARDTREAVFEMGPGERASVFACDEVA